MTALAADVPFDTVSGTTFRAVLYPGLIYLSVAPSSDISDALSNILPLARLRFWTVEWSNEEPDGWDTYLVSRDLV